MKNKKLKRGVVLFIVFDVLLCLALYFFTPPEVVQFIASPAYRSYVSGNRRVEKGDMEGAFQKYLSSIHLLKKEEKKFFEPYLGVARDYMSRKDYESALPYLDEAILIKPSESVLYKDRSYAKFSDRQKDQRGALIDIATYIRLMPDDYSGYALKLMYTMDGFTLDWQHKRYLTGNPDFEKMQILYLEHKTRTQASDSIAEEILAHYNNVM